MINAVPAFVAQFNKVVDECSIFRFITRDSSLQKDACRKLEDLLTLIEAEKGSAIASGEEEYANLLLGCKCAASGLISEIRMWLFLKDGKPDLAWDALVDAQDKLSSAMRAHGGFAHLDQHVQRLDAIEHLIFPPQVFLSSGMIVKSQICSICGNEYEDCEHLKGRPYMGEFCIVSLIPAAVDHIAIVDKPANKRCRIFNFSDEGGYRNRMTWAIEPKQTVGNEPEGTLRAEGAIATIATAEEKNGAEHLTFND